MSKLTILAYIFAGIILCACFGTIGTLVYMLATNGHTLFAAVTTLLWGFITFDQVHDYNCEDEI